MPRGWSVWVWGKGGVLLRSSAVRSSSASSERCRRAPRSSVSSTVPQVPLPPLPHHTHCPAGQFAADLLPGIPEALPCDYDCVLALSPVHALLAWSPCQARRGDGQVLCLELIPLRRRPTGDLAAIPLVITSPAPAHSRSARTRLQSAHARAPTASPPPRSRPPRPQPSPLFSHRTQVAKAMPRRARRSRRYARSDRRRRQRGHTGAGPHTSLASWS